MRIKQSREDPESIRKWNQCVFYQYMLVMSVRQSASLCDCALLSGDVSSSFVVSLHFRPKDLRVFTVDLNGEGKGDVRFARYVAKRVGVNDHIIITPSDDEFREAVDIVIKELETVDPVLVAEAAADYLALKSIKEYGCRCLVTGDGGKELFLGYPNLTSLTDDELREWIRRFAAEAWFPSTWVGDMLDLPSITPLYSEASKEVALQAPLHCFIDRERGYGELLLRNHLEAVDLKMVAWRRTPSPERTEAFKALTRIANNAGSDCSGRVAEVLGFNPPTKLHAYLGMRFIDMGMSPPPKCSGGRRCPICGRCLTRNRCKFCGAYIREGRVNYLSPYPPHFR